jgi:hypothetical protein
MEFGNRLFGRRRFAIILIRVILDAVLSRLYLRFRLAAKRELTSKILDAF